MSLQPHSMPKLQSGHWAIDIRWYITTFCLGSAPDRPARSIPLLHTVSYPGNRDLMHQRDEMSQAFHDVEISAHSVFLRLRYWNRENARASLKLRAEHLFCKFFDRVIWEADISKFRSLAPTQCRILRSASPLARCQVDCYKIRGCLITK